MKKRRELNIKVNSNDYLLFENLIMFESYGRYTPDIKNKLIDIIDYMDNKLYNDIYRENEDIVYEELSVKYILEHNDF